MEATQNVDGRGLIELMAYEIFKPFYFSSPSAIIMDLWACSAAALHMTHRFFMKKRTA